VEVTRFERRNGRSIPNNTVSRVFPRVAGDIVCYTPNLKFQRIASVTDGPLAVDSFQAIAGGFLSEVPPSNPRCVSVLSEFPIKRITVIERSRYVGLNWKDRRFPIDTRVRSRNERITKSHRFSASGRFGSNRRLPFPDVDFFSTDTSHGHVPRAPLKVEIILEVRE